MSADVRRPAAVLLDLQGTLYANDAAIPGATEAVQALRASGAAVRFITNIESRPAAQIAAELAELGLDIPVGELFTPLAAARELLAATPGARVLTMLSADVRADLGELATEAPCTHVLVGDCREILTYGLLDDAFRALRAGAELVALQRGRYFLRDDGEHVDTGAVVAALEYAAGVHARVLGKPSVDFFTLAARSAGVAVADCAVVGDDVTTDVAGGAVAGAMTVQVRTGKYAQQAAEGIEQRADVVVDSIADVPAALGLER